MRRLIVKLSLLVGAPAMVVLVAAPEHAVDGVRGISPLRYQLWSAARASNTIRAIALGDSHAAMGFRSSEPAVYSLAFAGENLSEIVLKARVAVRALPRVSVVFLQAQPHMFYPHRAGEARTEWAGLLSSVRNARPHWASVLLDPCCRGELPGMILRRLLHLPVTETAPSVGAQGFLHYPDGLRVRGPLQADAHREVRSYVETVANPDMQRRYQEMVAELAGAPVHVVLTRYPLSPDYLSALGGEPLRAADEFFTTTARRFGASQCGGWDAFDDRVMFFNSDHLAPEGAAAYWESVLSLCARTSIATVRRG